jgi:hypothetical protein
VKLASLKLMIARLGVKLIKLGVRLIKFRGYVRCEASKVRAAAIAKLEVKLLELG